eukprot:Amastigsp_a676182_1679.p3 type:complete len:138 gc:universal Amastigsp_a676182_1679:717-1130(+)
MPFSSRSISLRPLLGSCSRSRRWSASGCRRRAPCNLASFPRTPPTWCGLRSTPKAQFARSPLPRLFSRRPRPDRRWLSLSSACCSPLCRSATRRSRCRCRLTVSLRPSRAMATNWRGFSTKTRSTTQRRLRTAQSLS